MDERALAYRGPLRLRTPTDPRWVALALSHFDEVLADHAHCEKKAATMALSLLQAHPEIPELPLQMAKLAREESGHLAAVLVRMAERGQTLGRDGGDPYAQGMMDLLRKTSPQRRLDRLLVASIIEARSCERLELLAAAHPEPAWRAFYAELSQSEFGHQELFYRLAVSAHGKDETDGRLDELLEAEAQLLARLPLRAAMH